MDIDRLGDFFPPEDIEWRIGLCGVSKKDGQVWAKALAYVTSRAIRARLNKVCGPMLWQNKFIEWHGTAQLCGISIYNEKLKEWITKWDGSDDTQFEGTKGGLSGAEKRAGYQWNIGDYLYKLPETFVKTSPTRIDGWNYETKKTNKDGSLKTPVFYWETPQLPGWAIPYVAPKNKKMDCVETPVDKESVPRCQDLIEDAVIETAKALQQVAGDDWAELKKVLAENYPGMKTTEIVKEYGESILQRIVNDGIASYLTDIPY